MDTYETYGIYAITVNKRIVYIGMTMKDFVVRFRQHRAETYGESNHTYKYNYLRKCLKNGAEVSCIPLVSFSLEKQEISRSKLAKLERQYIWDYNPILNTRGKRPKCEATKASKNICP